METCGECLGEMADVYEEAGRLLCKHCFFKMQQDSMQKFLVKDAFKAI